MRRTTQFFPLLLSFAHGIAIIMSGRAMAWHGIEIILSRHQTIIIITIFIIITFIFKYIIPNYSSSDHTTTYTITIEFPLLLSVYHTYASSPDQFLDLRFSGLAAVIEKFSLHEFVRSGNFTFQCLTFLRRFVR